VTIPELPEVETIKNGLQKKIVGKEICKLPRWGVAREFFLRNPL